MKWEDNMDMIGWSTKKVNKQYVVNVCDNSHKINKIQFRTQNGEDIDIIDIHSGIEAGS